MVSLIYTEHAIIIVHLETAEIVGETRYSAVAHYCIARMSEENGWK